MSTRGFLAIMLCSAIVTLDGTAVTVALADIRRDLNTSFATLQWLINASLLMLASFLIPAGALSDRYGCRRVMRLGLIVFAAASAACALAPAAGWLIAARFAQGAGAALILPGGIAILRATYREEMERTRAFAMAAGAAGLASAVGPVLGGALVDVLSWRAVFIMSATVALAAALLLGAAPESRKNSQRILSLRSAALIVLLFGSLSYALIEGGGGNWASGRVLAAFGIGAAAAVMLPAGGQLYTIIPREIATSPNCLAANAATAVLYFGLFGLSFLLVVYTQAVLEYSAVWAGVSVLPIAVVMLFCDRFGQLAASRGSRMLIMLGALLSAAGIFWLTLGPHPLPFWSYVVPGTTLFGTGLAMAIGPLTHAAISSLPGREAGSASGMHHATVRAAGLVAIAALGTIAAGDGQADGVTPRGFRLALIVCGCVVLLPGTLAARWIRDDARGGLRPAAAEERDMGTPERDTCTPRHPDAGSPRRLAC